MSIEVSGRNFVLNNCVFYTVPAIYDITIVSRGDDPSLLDVINAKPSAADVLIR